MENIYQRLAEVEPERIRELLRKHEDDARMSKQVATILTEDGDLDFELSRCATHDFDMEKLRGVFDRFAFRTHLGRVEKLNKGWEQRRAEEMQVSLF